MDPSEQKKFCPECGTPNRIASKFCVKCGTLLPSVPAPEAPPAIPPAAPKPRTAPLEDPGPDAPTIMPGRATRSAETTALPIDDMPTRTGAPPPPSKTEKLPTEAQAPLKLPDVPSIQQPAQKPNQATAKLPGLPNLPPEGKLPPAGNPPRAAGPVPPAANTPPPPPGKSNRMLLIGGGCLVALIILVVLAFITSRAVATLMPPAVTPRPTAESTATAETERPTNVSIIQTSQAEQDGTATAEAEQLAEPTIEATVAPTLTPRSLRPKATPTEEVAPTEEVLPTEEPAIVQVEFTAQDAQDARERHDTVVATYKRLLFETFEEGNRTKARWNHGIDGRSLVNNRYEITNDEPRTYNADYWKQQPANFGEEYTVELEVRFPDLEKFSRVGIVFDVQEDTTKNWLYLMGSDGNWYIFRNEERIGSGRLPEQFEINPNTPYVLWVWRIPGGVLFFFNGELIAFVPVEAIGSDFPTGKVGVAGVSGPDDSDAPITVFVDNFLVARK